MIDYVIATIVILSIDCFTVYVPYLLSTVIKKKTSCKFSIFIKFFIWIKSLSSQSELFYSIQYQREKNTKQNHYDNNN